MTSRHALGSLRRHLDRESFPLVYTHKFIGRNSVGFTASVSAFETRFPGLRRSAERRSSGERHVALTYQLEARSPDEILRVLEATGRIDDLVTIL